MLDMTTVTPRRVRPAGLSTIARPVLKPAPLTLLPAWRVDGPAPVVTMAEARAGRIRALEAKVQRKTAALQPVETVLLNPEFAARVAAIQARRAGVRPVAATMPLAAG